jgi:hypothetical protein
MGEPPFNEVHPAIASVSVMIILDMPSSALHCTGQDRTGQDRTGQDRTGQDRTKMASLIATVSLSMPFAAGRLWQNYR